MNQENQFCRNCGNRVFRGQKFCAHCGTSLEAQFGIPNKKRFSKFKLLAIVGGIFGIVMIISIALAIILPNLNKDQVVMVYMIGSNLESEASAGSLDITEMEQANFNSEHTKVLVYTGGAKKWGLEEISADENAIFEVKNGKLEKVTAFEQKNMTESSTLTEYIDFVYDNYKVDNYNLILWDHGGGPIFGYGLDENQVFSSPISLNKMSEALGNTNLIKNGKKFEIIGFDACLMGSIEVANTLKTYGKYMVASEEVEPGWGWDYTFLEVFSGNVSAREIGERVVDNFISQYDEYPYEVDLSLSMIDLGKVEDLAKDFGKLFSKVKNEINVKTYSEYSRKLTREKVYGYNGRNSESYDLVDFLDLVGSLKNEYPEDYEKIVKLANDSIVYSRSNMDNTNGISVYFPNFNKANVATMLSAYEQVSCSDEYYEFLNIYEKYITGDKMVSRTVYGDLVEEKEGETVSVELPDELRDNYQRAEIVIFRKLGENKFMPIYRGSNVTLNGSTLSTDSMNLQFVVEMNDKEGTEYGWIAMVEKERTEEYADYTTFGVLWYEDNNSIIGMSPESYEMHLRLPSGSNEVELRDIKVTSSSDSDLASKQSFDPNKIKIIDFTVGTYKLFNDGGVLDNNFESFGTLYGSEVNLSDGDTYKIKLVGLDFDFGSMYEGEFESGDLEDYYAEFIVYDTQGGMHRLNLIHI